MEIDDECSNENSNCWIQLLRPNVALFRRGLTSGVIDHQQWIERGIHPIGIVSCHSSLPAPLGITEKRQLVTLSGGNSYPIEADEAGQALFRALDKASTWLWGHSWNSSLGEIFDINRRTTQRDRVAKNMLPPKILYLVSYLASCDDGREMAMAIHSVAVIHRRLHGNEASVRKRMEFVMDAFYGRNDLGLRVVAPDSPSAKASV